MEGGQGCVGRGTQAGIVLDILPVAWNCSSKGALKVKGDVKSSERAIYTTFHIGNHDNSCSCCCGCSNNLTFDPFCFQVIRSQPQPCCQSANIDHAMKGSREKHHDDAVTINRMKLSTFVFMRPAGHLQQLIKSADFVTRKKSIKSQLLILIACLLILCCFFT